MVIGERVRIRAVEKDDLPRFVVWLNDPEVKRNLAFFQPISLSQEEKWFENNLEQPPGEQSLSLDIRLSDVWEHFGGIGFRNCDQRERSAEIGIMIGRKDFWNQGYGCEAMRLMAGYGFGNLNLNRIYLQVFETNPAGIRCYEKAGFKHEGRLREARYHEGHYIDVLMMSILKNDWKKENGGNV
ncbi:MAG TPA: GNAT family protein [Pelolinea sp.]|nr:GNAT family protein [Pelolinea sp.]